MHADTVSGTNAKNTSDGPIAGICLAFHSVLCLKIIIRLKCDEGHGYKTCIHIVDGYSITQHKFDNVYSSK